MKHVYSKLFFKIQIDLRKFERLQLKAQFFPSNLLNHHEGQIKFAPNLRVLRYWLPYFLWLAIPQRFFVCFVIDWNEMRSAFLRLSSSSYWSTVGKPYRNLKDLFMPTRKELYLTLHRLPDLKSCLLLL